MFKIEVKIGFYCFFFFINVFESNKLYFWVIDFNFEVKNNINYVLVYLYFCYVFVLCVNMWFFWVVEWCIFWFVVRFVCCFCNVCLG